MAEAAFNLADWISLTDVGEYARQKNDGHRGLARGDVQAALEAGCSLMLRWIGDDGRAVCREFLDRDSWNDVLVWAGLPQRLCIQLPPDERKGNLPYPLAYLLRVDAVRLGLLPASELPQVERQPQQLPAATRSDKPAIADPAPSSAPAAGGLAETGSEPAARAEKSMPEPESELAKAERTRWQRDRTIEVMKEFFSPHGIHPKGMSIQRLTDRINKLPEFKENQVSPDTVRLADIELRAARKK